MLVFLIVLLVIIIIMTICDIKDPDTHKDSFGGGIVAGILFTSLIISICVCIIRNFDKQIEPIDVYRGNTTLEITYRDSVAIDSTVVWK